MLCQSSLQGARGPKGQKDLQEADLRSERFSSHHPCLVPQRTEAGGTEETAETALESKDGEWVPQHCVDVHTTFRWTPSSTQLEISGFLGTSPGTHISLNSPCFMPRRWVKKSRNAFWVLIVSQCPTSRPGFRSALQSQRVPPKDFLPLLCLVTIHHSESNSPSSSL